MTFYILGELVDEIVIFTNSIKMSRQPNILDNFSLLDIHYNSNLLGVDVKARCGFIFVPPFKFGPKNWNTKCVIK